MRYASTGRVPFKTSLRKAIQGLCLGFALFAALGVGGANPAYACACVACAGSDCSAAAALIRVNHERGETEIMKYISDQFAAHRDWYVDTFFKQNILPALQLFTEQMSAVAMQQVFMIGSFLDAKTQLETQRLFQELHFEAFKDYQPSEDLCLFGTNVRSLAASEQNAHFNTLALSSRQMARHLGQANTIGAESRDQDKRNRWKQFVTKYCDPHDNNWIAGTADTGLSAVCASSNSKRTNIDVDYTRLIEDSRTLAVSFTHPGAAIAGETTPTADEEDVIALGNNLYDHDLLTRNIPAPLLEDKQYQHLYLALRSVAAKRSVAENSYNTIVGLKSSGSSDLNGTAANTRQFLGAIMKELGVPENEVYSLIGQNPSYYAQLEILAKRIYQNPNFYANLYDKPANVQRKSVALRAIDMMLDRAIFESQLRQEMLMSVLLSSKLRAPFRSVNSRVSVEGGD